MARTYVRYVGDHKIEAQSESLLDSLVRDFLDARVRVADTLEKRVPDLERQIAFLTDEVRSATVERDGARARVAELEAELASARTAPRVRGARPA